MEPKWKYVILGAGCAGLSLCHYMLEQGVTEGILVLDQKPAFTDDRTWCFWNTHPTPFDDLATQSWKDWAVIGSEGEQVRRHGAGLRYLYIRGQDFYRRVQETLAQHPNVCLRLGERILGYDEEDCRVRVRTDQNEYSAESVFDSTATPHPAAPSELFTYQHFFGQIIRTEKPCFDPACCTLMDFRCEQSRGLHFLYVLPFSPNEALVENTYIGRDRLPAEFHREEISEYLVHHFGASTRQVLQEEAGCIPLTARPLPVRRSERTFRIGTAGGCSKASTGYTFLRIQDQCRRLAEWLTHPDRKEPGPPDRKYVFFDIVFLTALLRAPEQFPRVFCRLFDRLPPKTLVRFLSEESDWGDDLRVVLSLCPAAAPFLSAAARSAPQWLLARRP